MSYFRGLFGNKEMRILILGLDGAGKTTLLYRLQVRIDKTSFINFTWYKKSWPGILNEIPMIERSILIL